MPIFSTPSTLRAIHRSGLCSAMRITSASTHLWLPFLSIAADPYNFSRLANSSSPLWLWLGIRFELADAIGSAEPSGSKAKHVLLGADDHAEISFVLSYSYSGLHGDHRIPSRLYTVPLNERHAQDIGSLYSYCPGFLAIRIQLMLVDAVQLNAQPQVDVASRCFVQLNPPHQLQPCSSGSFFASSFSCLQF